ncbi:MAG: malto-oligosyltrehalose synthase [Dehalococcoidia bacterium]|nr:malto-oligosyltrehalose synthase [Dehalococcoidia bacterium]
MTSSPGRRYGVPRATYRLQLHPGFGFEQAEALVPYLAGLGVSHLYLSPFFAAAPGSQHGYDVYDHNQVNRELGGLGGLYALGEALATHDMGLVADVVPNHVGIAGGGNPWWQDVLRHGQSSPYAGYFDIDWEGQPQMPTGVLGFPVLGRPFGVTLEAGELQLELVDQDIRLSYYENVFPLAPHTYREVIGIPPLELRTELKDPASLPALIEILDALPTASRDEAEHLLSRFRALLASEPALERHVADSVRALNGTPGQPESFDRLEAILLQQHYRLSDWRVSGEELNYRRFFDINHLAAIRVEREEVFNETHGLLLDLVRNGIVTAVRIDHIDGLYDPAAYLARLRARLDDATAGRDGAHVPVLVEKILEGHERLPVWPIEGTTGYDFLAQANALLVDRENQRPMTQLYEGFTGRPDRFHRVVYDAKLHVASTAFSGEINVLALQLYRIGQRHRLHRDHTLRALRRAITGVLACFPVYRTYIEHVDPGSAPRVIRRAVTEAASRDASLSREALDFLAEVLLLEREDLDPDEYERRLHFRRRFQQVSGPVVAKGLEDTAFYRYNRLVGLNEVGGDPGTFGLAPAAVHNWFEERARDWPGAMSCSSTHDTKRSEDVRARLAVLSEIPDRWRREVNAWARMNDRHRSEVHGELYPDRNTEYFIYQALVGAWPNDGVGDDFRERIHTHVTKAMREAKLITSWVEPDEPVEAAVHAFVDAIMDPRRARAFLRRVDRLVADIRAPAVHNSIVTVLLKMLAPGFPDIYQGSEVEVLALTDPDNRRPVDFEAREDVMREVRDLPAPGTMRDPLAKPWFLQRALQVREAHEDILARGGYRQLEVEGPATGPRLRLRPRA